MDLSSIRAWLRACFHFHSMEELLELSCSTTAALALPQTDPDHRCGLVLGLSSSGQRQQSQTQPGPVTCEVSPGALLTWARLKYICYSGQH